MSKGPRVLVVDDQPANLLLVSRVLQPAGFDVLEARSGGEALAVARETIPDLILLDIHLPDMHGLDVLRRLRESAWGAGLRVAAMSAMASPEDQRAWLEAGCVGVIEKPIEVKTFAGLIRRLAAGEAAAPPERTGAAEPQPERPAGRRPGRIGEILLTNLLITQEQLDQALAAQAHSNKRLGQTLVEQGAISEDDLAWALSNQLGYPYMFLTADIADEAAVRLLPEEFQREHRVLPVLAFGEELTLAMADPTDQHTVDEVAQRTGLQVKRALALASNIAQMQERFFARRAAAAGTAPLPESAPGAQYLQFHIVQALRQGAAEIHFDLTGDGQARVRYRIEDVLVDRSAQPVELHVAMLRHLRALTGAGEEPVATASTTLEMEEAGLTLVAAFLPTLAGPAGTVGLYRQQVEAPDVAGLAATGEPFRRLQRAAEAARGLILIGCADRWARSTLLHSLIPRDWRGKVWVMETVPIYRRPTLNQTLIASPAKAAATLRAAASSGADLIALDDASDDAALVAAHEVARARLVLAGHSQDDLAGLLSQALDIAGPARVASSLRGLMAARPIRTLCPACRQTGAPIGCAACGFTGFRGIRLLTDAWLAEAESRRRLRTERAVEVLDRLEQSPAVMLEQGRRLVADGLTSPDELARVMGDGTWT